MQRIRLCLWTLAILPCSSALAQDFIPPVPLANAGLVKYWQLQLLLEPDQTIQTVYLIDDQLYAGTQDGYVFAVHAPTGVLRWVRQITRSGYPVRRPCHAGEQVIFVTPSDLQVYNRRTGEPLIRTDLRFPAGGAPVSDGARIFLGGVDHRLYAFDARTHYLDWRLVTSGAVNSTPTIRADTIYFANDAGAVYACTRENKTFRWQTSTYDQITADLVVDERGVFVASRDYSLYLLDLNFGNIRWRARLSGPLYEAPVLTPDTVYQYTPADGLVAIDSQTIGETDKRIRWKLPNGRTLLTVHKDRAYVLTRDGTVAVLNVGDGTPVMDIPADGLTLGLPAPEAETVYVAGPDGRLFCARPVGVTPLSKEEILAALQPPRTADAGATSRPTTQPAAKPVDRLVTERLGPVSGGRSKVSQEFRPGSKPE